MSCLSLQGDRCMAQSSTRLCKPRAEGLCPWVTGTVPPVVPGQARSELRDLKHVLAPRAHDPPFRVSPGHEGTTAGSRQCLALSAWVDGVQGGGCRRTAGPHSAGWGVGCGWGTDSRWQIQMGGGQHSGTWGPEGRRGGNPCPPLCLSFPGCKEQQLRWPDTSSPRGLSILALPWQRRPEGSGQLGKVESPWGTVWKMRVGGRDGATLDADATGSAPSDTLEAGDGSAGPRGPGLSVVGRRGWRQLWRAV